MCLVLGNGVCYWLYCGVVSSGGLQAVVLCLSLSGIWRVSFIVCRLPWSGSVRRAYACFRSDASSIEGVGRY